MLDQRVDAAPYSVPDPTRRMRPSNASEPSSSTSLPGDRSTIGKSLLIKGVITGSESLYIEGTVEGSVNLPDDRVTVGRNGRVSANIAAREIVVFGEVVGTVNGKVNPDSVPCGTERAGISPRHSARLQNPRIVVL
jgi:Polymer-forming cytoskeletal